MNGEQTALQWRRYSKEKPTDPHVMRWQASDPGGIDIRKADGNGPHWRPDDLWVPLSEWANVIGGATTPEPEGVEVDGERWRVVDQSMYPDDPILVLEKRGVRPVRARGGHFTDEWAWKDECSVDYALRLGRVVQALGLVDQPTVTDEQTRPSQQQIAVMMADADPWTVLGTAINDATVRNMTRDEALAVFKHIRYVLDACGLTVVNLDAAVAAEREACAELVWGAAHAANGPPEVQEAARDVETAIRNRGEAT